MDRCSKPRLFGIILLAASAYLILPAISAGAAGGGNPGGHAEAQSVEPPTFEPGACPETAEPNSALENARCGFLVVPENRSEDDGRTIRLAVAIVPAVSPTPAPDPVVYVTGGPGGSAITSAPLVVEYGVNADRDLIILEQRGTLFSEPSLTCPEIDRYNSRVVRLAYDARSTGRAQVNATRACRRRLVEEGVDLAGYNTTESAADLADLRTVLGISEWNVLGASYGTDLSLTYMREHPEGIRSVTIDSVVPPQLASVGVNWTSAGIGMKNLFRACADQPQCRERYPRPGRTFDRVVRELEADPITTRVKPALIPGDEPEPRARPVKVVLDGGAFANYIINIAGAGFGADVPRLLDDFARGRRQQVLASQAATGALHAGELSYGLQYGVVCSEWVPYERQADVIAKGEGAFPNFPTSVLANAPQFPFRYEDCPVWDVPKAPEAQREVTRSSIPTLVLAGGFDTLTSTKSAREAARTLASSTVVTIPGVGHVVLNSSDCARLVTASFLSNPTAPDTRCVETLEPPKFTVEED